MDIILVYSNVADLYLVAYMVLIPTCVFPHMDMIFLYSYCFLSTYISSHDLHFPIVLCTLRVQAYSNTVDIYMLVHMVFIFIYSHGVALSIYFTQFWFLYFTCSNLNMVFNMVLVLVSNHTIPNLVTLFHMVQLNSTHGF